MKMLLPRRRAGGLLSAFALLALCLAPALAQRQGPPPPGGKGAFGKISAVTATSITLKNREGTATTFTIASTATVTLDGATVAVDALAAGQFAMVASSDGTTATAIDARTKMGPPPGGGPHGPGGPGGPPPDGGPGGPGGPSDGGSVPDDDQ